MRSSRYHIAFRLIAEKPEREVRMRVDFSDEMDGLDSAERRFGIVFAPFRRNLYNLGRLAIHRLVETYKWTTLAVEIIGEKGAERKTQFMLNRSFDAVGADDSDAEYAPLVTRFTPGSVSFIEEKENKRRQELRGLDHLHKEISGKVKKAMPWIADAMRSLSAGDPLPPNPPEVHVSIGKLGGPEGPRGDYGREEWERFYRRGPSPDELKPMKLPSPYGFTASAIDHWIEELQKYSIAQWAREKKPETLRTVISNLMTAVDAVSQEDKVLNDKAEFAIQKWNAEQKKKRMRERMQEQQKEQQLA